MNDYLKTMQAVGWVKTFRHGTLKALEGRLRKIGPKVQRTMHLPMIGAQQALLGRIRSYIKVAKAIHVWRSSQAEETLGLVLPHLEALAPFFDHEGLSLAPDLMLLKFRAKYQVAFDKQGSVLEVVVLGDLANTPKE